MTPAFWHERWAAGQIGFHQPEIHVNLRKFWPELGLKGDERVFVPLCGKSLDMLWLLEQGHRVVGVEVSPRAAADFFAENGLVATQRQQGDFTRWQCDELELLQGDFFSLTPAILGQFDAVYDRASLIALPPEMRGDYAKKFRELAPAQLRVLLITLEYQQQLMGGPPFSVEEQEVRKLYGDIWQIDLLEEVDVIENEGRFKQKGLDYLLEKTYLLRAL